MNTTNMCNMPPDTWLQSHQHYWACMEMELKMQACTSKWTRAQNDKHANHAYTWTSKYPRGQSYTSTERPTHLSSCACSTSVSVCIGTHLTQLQPMHEKLKIHLGCKIWVRISCVIRSMNNQYSYISTISRNKLSFKSRKSTTQTEQYVNLGETHDIM
jgi:hypothetical protein